MACPHIAGIVALLRVAHPDWSPAAIKSEIMTTADPMKDEGEVDDADVFAVGAGFVNASKAVDPGMIFDIHPRDYVSFLLGLGYTMFQVEMVVGKGISSSESISGAELNMPSFAVALRPGEEKGYTRIATNVGKDDSVYKIESISSPVGVTVDVVPKELKFTGLNEKLAFKVSFTRELKREVARYIQGSVTWRSGEYLVKIPFSVEFV